MSFTSQTLSIDPRTIKLVQLAVRHMKNVHTLRIIFGHPTLTDALLRCFFDKQRSRSESGYARIRKLWLENVRVSAGLDMQISHHPYNLPLLCSFSGLESVRFRRLPMRPGTSFNKISEPNLWSYSRSRTAKSLQDGLGGRYMTTIMHIDEEHRYGEDHVRWLEGRDVHLGLTSGDSKEQSMPLEELYELPARWDDLIYQEISSTTLLPVEISNLGSPSFQQRAAQAYRGSWLDPDDLAKAPAHPFASPSRA